MARFKLFSQIFIRGITSTMDNKLYPRIYIDDINRSQFRGFVNHGSYRDIANGGSEYILLERYQIERNNSKAMAKLQTAMAAQMVATAVSIQDVANGFTVVYMSETTPMGDIILDRPLQLPIQDYFLNDAMDPNYTDSLNNTDTDLYQYFYRIVYRVYDTGGNLCDGASNYVTGVTSSDFIDSGLISNDGTSLSLFGGSGTMYSKTNDGTIVIKGMPAQLFSPRYRGPIEAEKAAAQCQQFDANCAFLADSAATLRSYIAEQIDKLCTTSMTG